VRWRRSPRVLWRTAPSYLALATVDGRIAEVGGPGCDIWERLAGWITEEELTAALSRKYGTDERVVSPDVRSLLQDLHAQGYVDRDD
jgi:hypothetical protein